ncbi:unnamed protein product [Cladocopium goreaui]|uniref:Uncharacterized protein n=1 Tax=Cladocopium goreaui TaxID=2562237 RepID=A0A9P1DQE7_9DINO|nr:unnamed protein product [Cladocopium goreaui]
MTLLLQRTKTPGPQLCVCFAVSPKVKVFRSPSGTFCPKARGLSPQHVRASSLCVRCAATLFLPPKNALHVECNSESESKSSSNKSMVFCSMPTPVVHCTVCQLPELRKHSE